MALETAFTSVAARYGRRFGTSSRTMISGPLMPERRATST